MNEIRLGIIGSGFMGRTNAETITKYSPGARLLSIAGGSRAPQLAADYGVECDRDVESLVNRKDIDAVFANFIGLLKRTRSFRSSISPKSCSKPFRSPNRSGGARPRQRD